MLGVKLCFYHLEIFNNIIFQVVFCKSHETMGYMIEQFIISLFKFQKQRLKDNFEMSAELTFLFSI